MRTKITNFVLFGLFCGCVISAMMLAVQLFRYHAPKPSPLKWGYAYYTNVWPGPSNIVLDIEEPKMDKFQTIWLIVTNSSDSTKTLTIAGKRFQITTQEEFIIQNLPNTTHVFRFEP